MRILLFLLLAAFLMGCVNIANEAPIVVEQNSQVDQPFFEPEQLTETSSEAPPNLGENDFELSEFNLVDKFETNKNSFPNSQFHSGFFKGDETAAVRTRHWNGRAMSFYFGFFLYRRFYALFHNLIRFLFFICVLFRFLSGRFCCFMTLDYFCTLDSALSYCTHLSLPFCWTHTLNKRIIKYKCNVTVFALVLF